MAPCAAPTPLPAPRTLSLAYLRSFPTLAEHSRVAVWDPFGPSQGFKHAAGLSWDSPWGVRGPTAASGHWEWGPDGGVGLLSVR